MQYVRLRIIEKFRGISSTYDHHVLRQDEGYERDCIWNRMRYDRTIKREEKKMYTDRNTRSEYRLKSLATFMVRLLMII